MKNVLICERFALEALMKLKLNKNLQVENYSAEKLKDAHALIIRSKFAITRELLEQAPALEVIVTCTSGFDHIDLAETQKRQITVMFTPDANATSAAELTWSLLMAANRQITAANESLKKGTWTRDHFFSNELSQKTIGIVGLGRIGQKVAAMAKAFQMNVLAFDPYTQEESFSKTQAVRCSYEELLKQSDFISFHVPATSETKNMFNKSHIEVVSPNLTVINTSRGQVINEDDLAAALNDKKLKFAALDVFNKEPLTRDSKLLKCSHIILTPHLGAYTEEAFLKASFEAAERIQDFFTNQKVLNTLPLQNDWGSLSFSERT